MRKDRGGRLLSLLLAALLALGAAPVTALADGGVSYGLWVDGIAVTSANAADVLGGADVGATVSYCADDGVLTLNGADLHQSHTGGSYHSAVIYAEGDLTLRVLGTNAVSAADGRYDCNGLYADGSIVIDGSGNLTVEASCPTALCAAARTGYAGGGVTVNGGTITLLARGDGAYGVAVDNPLMGVAVNGGQLEAEGEAAALSAQMLDFGSYAGCRALGSMGDSGSAVELSGSSLDRLTLDYYKFVKIYTPVLIYDENGFAPEGQFQPAERQDNGTESDPSDDWFEIKNAGNLFWFAGYLAEDEGHIGAGAKLTADISMPAGKSFVPLSAGPSGSGYSGVFDGQGHTVDGLYIHPETGYSATGLFKRVNAGGTVKNLALTGVDIGCDTSEVGGICGINEGTVENCSVTGAVTSSGHADFVGGICGTNDGLVQRCYSGAAVSAGNSSAGGICGRSRPQQGGRIENCYNAGAVSAKWFAGGICGDFQGEEMQNCHSVGGVSVAPGFAEWSHGIAPGTSGNNCYYLAAAPSADGGKTAAQFASGEVAYLLAGGTGEGEAVWGQSLADQASPVLGGLEVYRGYSSCASAQFSYSNDPAALSPDPIPHSGGVATCSAPARCAVCGAPYGELDEGNHSYGPPQLSWSADGKTCISTAVCQYNSAHLQVTRVPVPEIAVGGGQLVAPGTAAVFTFRAEQGMLLSLLVDGEELAPHQYALSDGGETVVLNADLVQSLAAGEHTLQAVFSTGTARVLFAVAEGQQPPDEEGEQLPGEGQLPGEEQLPNTGDALPPWPAGLCLTGACLGAAIVWGRRRRGC